MRACCSPVQEKALTPDPSPGVPGEGSKPALTPDPSPGVPGEGRNMPSPPTPLPEYRERGNYGAPMAEKTDFIVLWRTIVQAGGIPAWVDAQLTGRGLFVTRRDASEMSERRPGGLQEGAQGGSRGAPQAPQGSMARLQGQPHCSPGRRHFLARPNRPRQVGRRTCRGQRARRTSCRAWTRPSNWPRRWV